MVIAALAEDDAALATAPYRLLDEWRHTYGGNFLIALPDAFGTTAFLRKMLEWVTDWTEFPPDRALCPVAEKRGIWRKFIMVDIAVQRLVHPKDDLCHAAKSPAQIIGPV